MADWSTRQVNNLHNNTSEHVIEEKVVSKCMEGIIGHVTHTKCTLNQLSDVVTFITYIGLGP